MFPEEVEFEKGGRRDEGTHGLSSQHDEHASIGQRLTED